MSKPERPAIWYAASYSPRFWWMEPKNPKHPLQWLLDHEDAIHVTNAYDVLDAEFIADLKIEAGWAE